MSLSQYWTNDNVRKVWTLKDDAPAWLLAAVRDAHDGDLPNDWIYEQCRIACDAIDDGSLNDHDDSLHMHADGCVDIYTADLYRWAADMCLTDTFARAEEDKECGGDGTSTVDRLGRLQYFAVRYIADVILNAFEDAKGEES